MTSRERFRKTFRYDRPDRVFMRHQWVFQDTLRRWRREGMPWHEHFDTYFGFDRMEMVPLDTSLWPPLETRVIDRTAHWAVTEDELGGLVKSYAS